jgi:hypothetical protein
MAKKKVHPNSMENLRDRSAPDTPGDTVAVGVRLRPEDVEWLRSQPEGMSYHVRQAIGRYITSLQGQAAGSEEAAELSPADRPSE